MAVISGPSVSLEQTGATAASRSAWAVSWPLLLGLAVFAFLNNPSGLPILGDPDTHWHITVGNWVLAHGTVPTVDSYSFTFPGQPWIAKEWLSQGLLALAFNIGGWGGVSALGAAAIGFTFALLLRLLMRDLRPLPTLLFTASAIIMTAPHFLARPHVLAFPLVLLWVAGLVRAVEERRAPDWWLLAVMVLWANMHGGFTLGLMLAGALALDALVGARDAAERRTLFIAWAKFGVAALIAACVTPYGPESILVTSRIFSLGDSLGMIAEWRAPDFQKQPLQELVLLVALYLALSRGLKLPLIRLLIVLGLVHLFLRYARNAELLAMLAPLVLAPLLARQFLRIAVEAQPTGRFSALARPAGAATLAICLGLAGLYAGGLIGLGRIAPPTANTPVAAVAFARDAGLKGRVFNHYGYGGYLISAGIPTFIDGRGELFGGDFIKRYVQAVSLRDEEPFDALLDRWGIEWTLLSRDQPANRLLARLPGWRQAYSDDAAVIFVRDK
ncbi:hypothetical protein SAMN02990966_01477 [Rhodospirillales bacterium URHD0017]|nr:hypothetical protein SAMN02990966_01477 [Rhodospirillales bacterium URHD0017]